MFTYMYIICFIMKDCELERSVWLLWVPVGYQAIARLWWCLVLVNPLEPREQTGGQDGPHDLEEGDADTEATNVH